MLGVLLTLFAYVFLRADRAPAPGGLALVDALTGIPSRAAMLESLTAAVENARRAGSSAALYYIDLDGFKAINDTHGHPAGDAVLAEIAQRFRRASRRGEMLGRVGGDEFAAVVPRLEPDADVMELAYRLLGALRDVVVVDGASERIRASVGIAIFPEDGATPAELLTAADASMYRAKRAGGGTVVVHSESVREDLETRRRLRRDATGPDVERELVMCYQPLFESETGNVVGAESFVRWLHPRDGLLPAATILTAASNASASAGVVETFVLRAALLQACRWYERWPLPLYVNVSVPDAALLDAYDGVASESRVAFKLRFELTESAAMRLPGETAAFARECRRRCVPFGLDNFGTSPVDLAALERIAPDFVKLATAFVENGDGVGRGAAAAAMAIATALGIDIIAQGVSHPAQMPWLIAHGVRTMQGYYLAPPMTAVDFSAWLQARGARKADSTQFRAEA
ncbi:MAG: putative bifunctional diguanylate cyclase/phosphodiesterase [Candidatus Velthaea sp.]